MAKKQVMIVGAIGDSKPQSGTKKFLNVRVRVSNKTPNSDSMMNKVPNRTKFRSPGGTDLQFAAPPEISKEISQAPTSIR